MKKKTKEETPEIVTPEVSPEKEEDQDVALSLANSVNLPAKGLESQIQLVEDRAKLLAGFIERNLKTGVDYGSIAFHAKNCVHKGDPAFATKLGQNCKAPFCKMSKPFLQKPGSEKFTQLFGHRVKFLPIVEDFNTGKFAYKCLIADQKMAVLGEGRGYAQTAEKEKWTHNEAMKIAEKRALIDASLRVYGLSEHFTQDLDDMQSRTAPNSALNASRMNTYAPSRPNYQPAQNNAPRGEFTPTNPNAPMSQAQNNKIFLLLSKLGKDKEWLESWIFQLSGIEGVENMTMGLASRVIDAMQKKYDQMQSDGLDVITYPDEKENIKQETEVVPVPEKVKLPEDEWNGF